MTLLKVPHQKPHSRPTPAMVECMYYNMWRVSSRWVRCSVPITDRTLGGDGVNMLAHTWTHKPPRKSGLLKCPGRQPTLCVTSCLIWWFAKWKNIKPYHRLVCDAECPYWDQASLNNIKFKLTSRSYIPLWDGSRVCKRYSVSCVGRRARL